MNRPAFKNSELGPIPADWEVKRLGGIAPLQRGFDLPTSALAHGLVPVVYSNGILNFHKTGPCESPGLITGRSGTIGKFTFIERGAYWPHNTTLWVTSFCGNDPRFVYYLYSQIGFERFSGGTGVPTLNRNDLHAYQVALPVDIEEQHRIAAALSDADAWIESLDKLIEKKKLVKQGAMQSLLSGKTRLPRFSGKWVEKRLGDCGYLSRESINPQAFPAQVFLDFSMPNYDEAKQAQAIHGDQLHSAKTPIHGTVLLFNKLNVRQKRIWLVEDCPNNAICSSEFLPFYSDGIDLKFMSYYLATDRVTNDFLECSTGTSNSQKRITPKDFLDYLVVIPPTLAEQRAIAAILSDMDAELAALSREKAKAEQIKQGMMQELLTGRTRLGGSTARGEAQDGEGRDG